MPAAEEFGLLLQDKVKHWRATNAQKTIKKAEQKLGKQGDYDNKKAHPLIAWRIIEHSSWAEHDELQEIWAGLLASTCTECGEDDSNLIFINLVSQLTEIQIKILNYAVEKSKMTVHDKGLVLAENLYIELDELYQVTGINDLNRIDRELDHLSSLNLIGNAIMSGGINIDSQTNEIIDIYIRPQALTIQLYVRCQGFLGTPKEYFDL